MHFHVRCPRRGGGGVDDAYTSVALIVASLSSSSAAVAGGGEARLVVGASGIARADSWTRDRHHSLNIRRTWRAEYRAHQTQIQNHRWLNSNQQQTATTNQSSSANLTSAGAFLTTNYNKCDCSTTIIFYDWLLTKNQLLESYFQLNKEFIPIQLSKHNFGYV